MLSEGLGRGEGAVELRGAAEAGELRVEGSGNHRHGRSEGFEVKLRLRWTSRVVVETRLSPLGAPTG